MKKIILSFFILLNSNFVFAINKTSAPDATVAAAMTEGQNWLVYTMWAASALGIISVAFMLFHNFNDAILKHVTRVIAIISILALSFTVPGYFGLSIIL